MNTRVPVVIRHRYERRFTGETIPLTWKQRISHFLKYGEWVSEKFVMEEIPPDDPRYKDAPYAEKFIPHNSAP